MEIVTPWPQNINWKYIRRSEDIQDLSEHFMHDKFASRVGGQ